MRACVRAWPLWREPREINTVNSTSEPMMWKCRKIARTRTVAVVVNLGTHAAVARPRSVASRRRCPDPVGGTGRLVEHNRTRLRRGFSGRDIMKNTTYFLEFFFFWKKKCILNLRDSARVKNTMTWRGATIITVVIVGPVPAPTITHAAGTRLLSVRRVMRCTIIIITIITPLRGYRILFFENLFYYYFFTWRFRRRRLLSLSLIEELCSRAKTRGRSERARVRPAPSRRPRTQCVLRKPKWRQ